MLNEYTYHDDKDDNVEEHDNKDGSQVGTKEYSNVANEATTGRKKIII